jgi:molecular chaperone HscB
MTRCLHCATELETPVGCVACGQLLALDTDVTPFAILGWVPTDEIDARELHKRLLRFSRLTHPDYFAAASPAVRALAESNSARLNEARDILADDARRADWFVRNLGGPDENGERQMPKEFLLEVLEWNEVLEEAQAAGPSAATTAHLDELEQELRAQRAETIDSIRARLTPLPARGAPSLRDIRRDLNAVRYLDRALGDIEAQRLSRPTVR